MKQLTQGGRANRHGRTAEDVLLSILTHQAYDIQRQKYIGKGIFDTDIYVDFYLANHPSFPDGLIIESKWQDVSGSVDEKLPFLVENIRQCYPCPTIVVIHGGGFRPGAVVWLKRQVDHEKLYAAFRLEEFLSWCNRNL